MIVERFLNPKQLKRYRRWKADVRATLRLWVNTLKLAWKDGSAGRFFDKDYFPVFICGVSGSGTTLIGGLLDQDYESEICIHVSDRMLETDRSLWMENSRYYDDLDEYVEDLVRVRRYPPGKVRRAVFGLYRRLSPHPRRYNIVLDKAPNSHMVRIGVLRKAFPQSKAILIYRNPVEVIEGLIRKWPKLFGRASLETLCKFWVDLHESFMGDTRHFGNDLVILAYDQLTENPERWLQELAKWVGLQPREVFQDYSNQPNRPGKGLRNIVNGKIQVIKDAFREVEPVIDQSEANYIREQTAPTYEKLEAFRVNILNIPANPKVETLR